MIQAGFGTQQSQTETMVSTGVCGPTKAVIVVDVLNAAQAGTRDAQQATRTARCVWLPNA